ncbi:hypothetical protein LX16_2626 [Stackebrandtia albiflava]|uniref:Uncharacterized protein n=1 Tax=Stackebrandtia albiflava TaxID=406432 RepID=A0A562V1Y4_9ACTN|nr:DUF6069 family protein [Stackebrandtia albiflava]TWJ11888.1 hypothetical protein LX16_2626 [Stackebrandtia albiflava]
MTEPVYGSGRARPEPTPPPVPPAEPAPPTPPSNTIPRVNPARLWAGGLGTAVVVALVILVGIMLVRGILGIPVLAPEGAGAYGTAATTTYAFAAAVVAVMVTALLHALLAFMPRPMQFFYWICVLLTAVAVLLPFTFDAEPSAQIATAALNLVAGICMMSILGSIGSSAVALAFKDSGEPPPVAYDQRGEPLR